MSAPRILILFNDPVLPPSHPDAEAEREILEIADVVADELTAAKFIVSRLGVSRDPRILIERLTTERPDAVVNFFEGKCYRAQSPLLGATAEEGEFLTLLGDRLVADGVVVAP